MLFEYATFSLIEEDVFFLSRIKIEEGIGNRKSYGIEHIAVFAAAGIHEFWHKRDIHVCNVRKKEPIIFW